VYLSIAPTGWYSKRSRIMDGYASIIMMKMDSQLEKRSKDVGVDKGE